MRGDCNHVIADQVVEFDADLVYLGDAFQPLSTCIVHSVENEADLKLQNSISVLATLHPTVTITFHKTCGYTIFLVVPFCVKM